MTIEIRQHKPGSRLKEFLRAPREIMREDSNYVSPLDMMIRDMLSPKKNPFFEHGEAALFTAHRGGKLVGRISAQIDHEHLKRYEDRTGFFGFFDTTEDEEVAKALITAAEDWLRARGMQRIRGPLSLTINEEVGLLVDGFDTPNVLFMPHHRPYQQRLAEVAGLEKAKDIYAFHWTMGALPPRIHKAHTQIINCPEVRLREINFQAEIDELVGIQDDAWRHNWGHVSMTAAEAKQFAKDLSLLIDKRIAIVAEINGDLAAMAIAVPNLNEAIRDMAGKVSAVNIAKLLWRLKVQGTKSGRLVMLGIKERYRKQKRYGFLALAMVAEIAERGRKAGYEWAELGWTLEDNAPVNMLIKISGGQQYKTYRIYEKSLYAS